MAGAFVATNGILDLQHPGFSDERTIARSNQPDIGMGCARMACFHSIGVSYDNANRLAQVAQGSSIVAFAYDTDGRRTTVTLPNGVTMRYSYDRASQLTGINYTLGSSTLGNLTYTYDPGGQRTSAGG